MMSLVDGLTRKDAIRIYGLTQALIARDRAKPCEHGHFDCSNTERGPCTDEIAARFKIGHGATNRL